MSTVNAPSVVTVQAPPHWAGRTLAACEQEGGPFVAAFDDQAQVRLMAAQAQHLQQVSGIPLTVVLEASLDSPLSSEEPPPGPPKRSHRKKE